MPAAIPLLAGAAVVGTTASIYSSVKARKEQKKANRAQERIRQTQSARERLAQVRESRIAQAQVLQSGATQGTGDSSTTQGAYSAIGSTAAGNIQFINQMDSLQQEVFRRMEKANLYTAQAGYYSGAANLAMQAATLGIGSPTQSVASGSSGVSGTAGAGAGGVGKSFG